MTELERLRFHAKGGTVCALNIAELRASEEFCRLSFDHAGIGKSLSSLKGQFLRVNEAFCRLLGYTRTEMGKPTFDEPTHPDDLAASCGYVHCPMAGEQSSYQFEKLYLHKDRHIVWCEMNTVLLRDPVSSKPLHQITDNVEITES